MIAAAGLQHIHIHLPIGRQGLEGCCTHRPRPSDGRSRHQVGRGTWRPNHLRK